MWDYFDDRDVLITGASGFVGSALVCRIMSIAPLARLYLICRGGGPHLESQWRQHLPESFTKRLLNSSSITVIRGDLTQPNMGVDGDTLQMLKERVSVIIHAASSINLKHPLQRLSETVIMASERVARLALECQQLDRFVYISTAYANAFLYQETDEVDVPVRETIYPLGSHGWTTTIWDEWCQVRAHGYSMEFLTHDFPWPYAYAKHLTERLLLALFTDHHQSEKLLIMRPSIIAPAQHFPYRGFSIPNSTPSTILTAGLLLTPSPTMRLWTRAENPEIDSTVDEVPVDVVVDRLLVHLVHGTAGPVHAVSGVNARYRFQTFWKEAMRHRRIPWAPRPEWMRGLGWHSASLHELSRLYVIFGTSYNFSQEKTYALLPRIVEDPRSSDIQLFTTGFADRYELSPRIPQVAAVASQVSARRAFANLIMWLFYLPWIWRGLV